MDIERSKNKIRTVQWFYKKGKEYLAGSEDINLPAQYLKNLLRVGDEDDPELVCTYRLAEDKVGLLQDHLSHRVNTRRYTYFIGCYRVEE